MAHQRSTSNTFDWVSGWRCPLCNSTAYAEVIVERPNGAQYRTEFYECLRCTVMFRHRGQFARLGVPIRRWAGDIEPKSLREVHGFVVGPRKWPRSRRGASIWLRQRS